MLHKNVIEKKSGFRTLNIAELEAVSGGWSNGNDAIPGDQGHTSPQIDYFRATGIWVSDPGVAAVLVSSPGFQIGGFEGETSNDGSSGLLGKVPFIDEIDENGVLNDREKARYLTLQTLGVPAPLAAALAKATSYLSSIEFKTAMNDIFDGIGPTPTPQPSTGDPVEDLRRLFGPLLGPGPSLGPDFPE